MHSHGLGIFHVVNAEGMLILTKHTMYMDSCGMDVALRQLYHDFKAWCKLNKLHCTQRRWTPKQLHCFTKDGVRDFPSFKTKAFNSRIILTWLSVSWPEQHKYFFP